jgi:hypothetical protein
MREIIDKLLIKCESRLKTFLSQAWWCTPVIPAFQEAEDYDCETSLSYIGRLSLFLSLSKKKYLKIIFRYTRSHYAFLNPFSENYSKDMVQLNKGVKQKRVEWATRKEKITHKRSQ